MPPLNPPVSQLGLASPAIGPWFGRPTTGLPVLNFPLPPPEDDLSLDVTENSALVWFPPATGTLGLFVATDPRPRGLERLRKPNGDPAFTTGHWVALFRLLPEVEDRLHKLSTLLPTADGQVNSRQLPVRSRVRWFAFEHSTPDPELQDILQFIDPSIDVTLDNAATATDAQKAAHLGLALQGNKVTNGAAPMADLKRPGTTAGVNERLLRFDAGFANARLWAFDSLGHSIDPGAVASWWTFLANQALNGTLWADTDPARKGIAQIQPARTVHLVNAHEGPVGALMLGRLSVTGGAASSTGVITSSGLASGVVVTAPTPQPQRDPTPIARVALMPNGPYGSAMTVFAGTGGLQRDLVRVAAVDIERQLTGRPGVADLNFPGGARRADDQERVSTRIRCERTTAPVLLATTDEVADAAIATMTGDGAANVVTAVLDRDWAGLDGLSGGTLDLPDVDAPEENVVGNPTASALAGGGVADGSTVKNQRVLVDLDLPGNLVGAWVRGWTQVLDPETARHVRLDGGSARVRSTPSGGRATLVAPLADGSIDPSALMGIDFVLITLRSARFYMDRRFARPAPVPQAAVPFGSITGQVLICETGFVANGTGELAERISSGSNPVVLSTPPALIDRTTVPASAFTPDTAIRNLATGDAVALTRAAFKGTPDGEPPSLLQSTGATVRQQDRAGIDRPLDPGAPIPTMDRFEVAAARVGENQAAGVTASTPSLGRYHEFRPHRVGHPGAPGALDVHGTGTRLTDRAAVALAEYTRDRTNAATIDLVNAAITPFAEPTDPPGPTAWAAPLRTVCAGIEGEAILLRSFADSSDLYPVGDTLDRIFNFLAARTPGFVPPNVPGSAVASVTRAIDRRVTAAARGAQESAISLFERFNNAEDLVYIETPAIENIAFVPEQGGQPVNVVGQLLERMDKRPGLAVILCVPIRLMPEVPKGVARVRQRLLLNLVSAMRAKGQHRVVLFSPPAGPGRTLRFASTNVIVDDCYALTGTTHLWRRGLTFDSSLAIAVFDEAVENGRSIDVRRFRRQLIADQLDLPVRLLPEDPLDLVAAIKSAIQYDSNRLADFVLDPPDLEVTQSDTDAWDRDGAAIPTSFDVMEWINQLIPELKAQIQDAVNVPQP